MIDELGDRMKRYEDAHRLVLPPRIPMILRVDGRAFHTFTRGKAKPFDLDFCARMDTVARTLVDDVQGAQLAYIQSDEISILVHDYKRHKSASWFARGVQKMVSVAASVAAARMTALEGREATFDARVFLVPENDVANYFIWRQKDMIRNAWEMIARTLYPHAALHEKGQSELHKMIAEKGVNPDIYPAGCRRGRCWVRQHRDKRLLPRGPRRKDFVNKDGYDAALEQHVSAMVHRYPLWVYDGDIPIFTQDRDYIEKHLVLHSEDEETETVEEARQ